MKRQCVDRKKTRFNDAELTGGREKTRGKSLSIKFNRVYASLYRSAREKAAAAPNWALWALVGQAALGTAAAQLRATAD